MLIYRIAYNISSPSEIDPTTHYLFLIKKMPIDIISSMLYDGPEVVPGWEYVKLYAPVVAGLGALKYYCGGTSNTWERDMHGKVFMVTGGTSGMGARLVYELATKGAQIILLVRSTEDAWVVDYVEELRDSTNNAMIYAEECDLASLHSIRLFATKWLDNQPPRRLDGVLCCAAESIPVGKTKQVTKEGIERQLGINYFGHFHLLTLLGPSLRVQPPDRDVRVLLATCSTQALAEVDEGDLLWENRRYPTNQPWKVYGTSKLLLGLFAKEYQRQLMEYERKDKAVCNVRINLINPGLMRTPSTRRFLSMGTVWGLILYVIMWPFWFLVLKSSIQGAQSFIFALSAPIFIKLTGGNVVQECKIVTKVRKEMDDEELQKKIFQNTESAISTLEKQAAIERKREEKAAEAKLSPEIRKKEKARREDVLVKPETPEELEYKLNKLRSQIGISTSSGLPLFPDESVVTKKGKKN